jgi:hypothetical protein
MATRDVGQRPTTSDGVVAPRTRRAPVTIRLTARGLATLDERAARDHRTRSDMARLLLAYATQHMPDGWRPSRGGRS